MNLILDEGHDFINFGVLDMKMGEYDRQGECLAMINSKVSAVRILVVRGTANQIERKARVTFSDQLASLGDCLLSLCLYWAMFG